MIPGHSIAHRSPITERSVSESVTDQTQITGPAISTPAIASYSYSYSVSKLQDAFQGEVKSEKRYLPGALGAFPIEDGAVCFATKCAREDLMKLHQAGGA
jgi:hypothetical protein